MRLERSRLLRVSSLLCTMCGATPAWTPKANSAKCIGIGVLVMSILGLVCIVFFPYGWISLIGCILTIIASSLIICCGPREGSPARARAAPS